MNDNPSEPQSGPAKVVTLEGKPHNVPLPFPTAHAVMQDDIVRALEGLIAETKAGNIAGIGVAVVSVVHGPNHDYDIDTVIYGLRLPLLAGAARLTHRLNQACDDTCVPIPPPGQLPEKGSA